jgi:hypothetical protein
LILNIFPSSQAEVNENGHIACSIYDPSGKKINIAFNKDRTLTFSPNSTADIVEIAKRLAKTKIGLKILKLMDASATKITIEVNKTEIIMLDSTNIAAETYPIISTPINKYGRPNGSQYISEAKIIIYEAAIKDMAAKNDGKILINGSMIDTVNFSFRDIITSFSIHEFIHVLDNEFSSSLNPTATKAFIEIKPYAIQLEYLKELGEQKRIK